MNVFELDSNYDVTVSPELFMIESFAKLRDDRKDVQKLYKELAFIYYYTDLRSMFNFQTDKKAREADVKKYVGLPKSWKVDAKIKDCIATYEYLSQTVSSKLLKSVYLTVDKISTQLESIDLDERDKSGKPVWNVKQIVDTSKAIPQLLESIQQAEKAFLKGQEENDKLRGNKVKSLYEDGFNKYQK